MVMDSIAWLVSNFFQSFLNLAYAVTNPQSWLDWSDKKAIMRFVYYGGSIEFFFVVFTTFILLFFAGAAYRPFMWRMVAFFEGVANDYRSCVCLGWPHYGDTASVNCDNATHLYAPRHCPRIRNSN